MSHMPVDHPLRGLYRGLTLLTGAAGVVYGGIALAKTADGDFTDHAGERVVGIVANPAAGTIWIVLGAIALLATLVGRNLDTAVLRVLGPVLWAVGTIELCLIRTDQNVFAGTVTGVIALYLVGTLWFTAGLYAGVSGAKTVRPTDAAEANSGRQTAAAH